MYHSLAGAPMVGMFTESIIATSVGWPPTYSVDIAPSRTTGVAPGSAGSPVEPVTLNVIWNGVAYVVVAPSAGVATMKFPRLNGWLTVSEPFVTP